jgi:hypothetical protein
MFKMIKIGDHWENEVEGEKLNFYIDSAIRQTFLA